MEVPTINLINGSNKTINIINGIDLVMFTKITSKILCSDLFGLIPFSSEVTNKIPIGKPIINEIKVAIPTI